MIYVCNLREMPGHADALRPSHLISLVEPQEQPPTPGAIGPGRHLRVEIDDISEPAPGQILPEREHVARVIDFVGDWSGEAPLLIHCVAGISRSMAAAMITLSLKTSGQEAAAGEQIRQAAPHAHPNRRMVALADHLLDCGGRLVAAREAMGPGVPLMAGPLVRLSVP